MTAAAGAAAGDAAGDAAVAKNGKAVNTLGFFRQEVEKNPTGVYAHFFSAARVEEANTQAPIKKLLGKATYWSAVARYVWNTHLNAAEKAALKATFDGGKNAAPAAPAAPQLDEDLY